MLALDPAARGGIETLCTKDYLLVAGEARAPSQFDSPAIEKIARGVVRQLGYDIPGFDWSSLKVDVRVHTQSPDIARGRSEEHTSELQSLMRISYAVFCLKKKNIHTH